MDCQRVVFSGHAIQRMFERGIGRDAVLAAISSGETIAEYPGDAPYPSRLLVGWARTRPIHVVAAYDRSNSTCIVITVYEPSHEHWETGFKKRRAE